MASYMSLMTLALDVFLGLVSRRDALRRWGANNPVEKEELETLEEIVTALVGSDDERALEAYKAQLAVPRLTRSLH